MPTLSLYKSRLVGGAAVCALSAAAFAGGALMPASPVFADAVRIEAPQQVANFADVVDAVSPAVVSVRVRMEAKPASFQGGLELPEDHPFRRFFDQRGGGDREFGRRGQRDDRRGGNQPRYGASQGSGFFVSEDGYIVTNNHVVEDGSKFTVVTNDGREIDAKLIGTDPKTDLAVLKVEGKDYTHVSFAETPGRVGEWVVAVGNPFGLGGTVTAGIVSGMDRDIGSGPYDDYIQIDAAVNKGNSGGPAFNLKGEVIGVNTAIFSPSGGNVGIAFAISARSANEVVKDLIADGSVTRGWLGVQIQPVTDDIAASLGLKEATGTIVAEVQDDSPALKAGLKTGDIIQAVNGDAIEGPKELSRAIAGFGPDVGVELQILRDGKPEKVTVQLGTLPGEPKTAAAQIPSDVEGDDPVELTGLGLSIVTEGGDVIVAEVAADGIAAERGISEGDRIVSVNGTETASVAEVGKAVADAIDDQRKAVLLQVRSGERNRFVALPVDEKSLG